MLSAFVLLTTMNTLKLNADTLERIATCGIAQHVHDESCYDADGELACGLEEHVHTDACYQQRPTAEDKASTRIDEYVPLDAQVRLASPVEFISEDDEDTSVEISDVDDAVDEVMAELQNGDADDRGDEDDIDLLFTPDDEEALPVSGEDATEIDDTIFEVEGGEEIAAEDESEAEAEMIDGTIEDEVAEDATIEDATIEDAIIGDESVEDESIEIGTTDEENTKYTYELADSREVLLSTVLEALGIQLDQIDSASAAKSDEAVLSVALNEDGDYVITALEGFEKGEIVVVGMESETVAAYIIAITAAKAEEETEVGEADKAEEAPEIKVEEEATEEKKDAEETVEEETEKAEENAEEQTEVEEIKDEDGAEEVQESDEESEAAEVAIVENDNVTIVPVGDNSLSGNLEIVYNENVNKQSVVDRLDAILNGAYQPGMMSTSSAAMSGRALAGASAGNETAGQYSDYAVFDISLLDDGVQRSETGEVGVVVRPENVNIYDNLPGNATATNVEYTLYHIHNSVADTLPVSVDCGEDGSLLAVDFTTDSFSYFVLKYTVDFHYNGVDYSIPGESQILLSELIDILDIVNAAGERIDVADVESVSFTDDHLVTVQQVSGLITYNEQADVDVGEKDFLLTSLEPFSSDETLILTLTDGREIVVGVTDDVPTLDLATVMGSSMNDDAHFQISTNENLDDVARNGKIDFHLMYKITDGAQLNQLRGTNVSHNGRNTYSWYVDLNVEDVGHLVDNANGYTGNLTDTTGTSKVGEFEFVGDKIYFYLYQDVQDSGEKVELSSSSDDLTVNLDFNVQMDETKVADKKSTDLNFPGTSTPHVTYKPYAYQNTTKTFGTISGTPVGSNGNQYSFTDADFADKDYITIPWTVTMTQPVAMNTLMLVDSMDGDQKLDPNGSVTVSWKKPDGTTGSTNIAASTLGTSSFNIDLISQTGLTAPIPANTEITVSYNSILTKEEVKKNTWRNNQVNWTINGNAGPGAKPGVEITYKDTSIQNGSKAVTTVGSNPFVEADKDNDGNYRLKYTLSIKEPVDVTNLSVTDTPDPRVTIDYSTFELSYKKGYDNPVSVGSISVSPNSGSTSFTVDLDSNFPNDKKVGGKIPADIELFVTYEATVSPETIQDKIELINTAVYTVEEDDLDPVQGKIWVQVDPEKGTKTMMRESTQVAEDAIEGGKFEIPYEAEITLKHPYSQLEFIDTLNTYHDLKEGSVSVYINGTSYPAGNSVSVNGKTFTVDIDEIITTNNVMTLPAPAGTTFKIAYTTLADADSVLDKNVKVENDSKWKFDNHDREGEKDTDDFTTPQDYYTDKVYTRYVDENGDVVYTFKVTIGDGSHPLDGHTVTDEARKTLMFDSEFDVECTSNRYATPEEKEASAAAVKSLIKTSWSNPEYGYQFQSGNTDKATVFSLNFPREGENGYAGPYYGPYVITYVMKSDTALLKQNSLSDYPVSNNVTHEKVTKTVTFDDSLPPDIPTIDKKFDGWDLDNGGMTYWTVEVTPPEVANVRFWLTEDTNFSKWDKTAGSYNMNTAIFLEQATAVYKNEPLRAFTDFTYDENNARLVFEPGVLTDPIIVTIPMQLKDTSAGHDIYVRNRVQLRKQGQYSEEIVQTAEDYAKLKNFYPQPTINKTVETADEATGNTTWKIEINLNQKPFPEGTYLTLNDVLPDGMIWGTGYGSHNEYKLSVYTQGGVSYNGFANPTTYNTDPTKGGGSFTLDLAHFKKADGTEMPIDINGTQVVVRYTTRMVDGEYDNLINVGRKAYTNTASVTDGGQFSGVDDAPRSMATMPWTSMSGRALAFPAASRSSRRMSSIMKWSSTRRPRPSMATSRSPSPTSFPPTWS